VRRRPEFERRLQALLGRLGQSVDAPGEQDLRTAARMASAEPRQPQERPVGRRRPWRPLRLRWAAAAAGLLLVATGLGFGFGTWLTPAGTAGRDVTGLGFLPANGWTVVQSGTAGSPDSAYAVAANTPIRVDAAGGVPRSALRALPRDGVVIAATLATRGDPAVDAAFPLRTLPLRFVDAQLVGGVDELVPSERRLTEYRLRAGVGGYNVDARLYFGGTPPSVSALKSAEQQLERLVVAADEVTIAVRPTVVVPRQPATAYGSVASGREGQKVTVQYRQCGLYPLQFRDVAEVQTTEGGGWSTPIGPEANGVYRALSGAAVSNEVKVLRRVDVRLSPTRSGKYRAYVVARTSFWHKRIAIERYDRKRGKWLTVKTFLLDDAGAAPGSTYVWSLAPPFKPDVPKGTTIRATLPLAQAKPCYIGGTSTLLRT
jgi:hypothetical protein